MKAMITSVCLLVLAYTAGAGAGSKTSELDGTWTLVDRVCTNGQPAKDRFQLGRDKMIMVMNGDQLTVETSIPREKQPQVVKGTFYTTSERLLITITESGQGRSQSFIHSNSNELVLISAGFGPGGSCAEGEALLSIFKRK